MPWARFSRHYSASNGSWTHHIQEVDNQSSSWNPRLHVDAIGSTIDRDAQTHSTHHKGEPINWIPRVNQSECLLGRMCEMDRNYPAEAIGRLVHERLGNVSTYLSTDEREDEDEVMARSLQRHVVEKQLCDVKKDVKYFQVGRPSGKAEFMYIVNEKTHRQRIPIELCTNANAGCSYVDSFERPVCRQKYIKLGLLAVNNEGSLLVEQFQVPVTCVCYVRSPMRRRRTTRGARTRSKSTKRTDNVALH